MGAGADVGGGVVGCGGRDGGVVEEAEGGLRRAVGVTRCEPGGAARGRGNLWVLVG